MTKQSRLKAVPEFAITELRRASADTPLDWGALLADVRRAESALGTNEEKMEQTKREILLRVVEELADNLDRTLKGVTSDRLADDVARKWYERLRRTHTLVLKVLARSGVVPIDLVSAPPGMVTIIETTERADVAEGTIVEVLKTGYLMRGSILRKAEVVVASTPGKKLA